jgi:hypothetical protein
VSARPGRELSHSDRQFEGGAEPSLLNVIEIDFLGHSPHPYQPENHTIDDKIYWEHVRTATFKEGLSALDPIRADLWGISYGSSYSGINDRVPEADAPSWGYSLTLIEVTDLRIHVSAEGASFGNMKRKLRGFFSYSHHNYALSITDPITET